MHAPTINFKILKRYPLLLYKTKLSLKISYFIFLLKSVSKILDQIRHKSAIKVTIGGCVIEKIENSVVIYKEITK